MRVLWAPWRLAYIEKAPAAPACIFCDKPARDEAARRNEFVLLVSDQVSIMMNLYPYANGHVMVAPRTHTADFARLPADTAAALQAALQQVVAALEAEFSPHGFNIGMNLGRTAGAGFAEHLHWHVVPRWEGDTNFMPLLAETRVIPQHLEETYRRLLPYFEES